MRKQLFVSFLAVIFLGCGTSNTTTHRSSRYVITVDDIAGTSATNGLELIQQLRPEWLLQSERRGVKSISVENATEPVVYVNESRYGDVASLRTLSINNIREIKYMKAREATTRFGTGHTGGAILVKLR
ncbi:MAG: hypothetical protein D6743_12785 [Calditrichaeota bacterium]|nr:MAG: hypothetical protein D6743_12785 [Calditrichota bacterium]